jgi:hypothetical protein
MSASTTAAPAARATRVAGPAGVAGVPLRRVRHEVRDGLAVMLFSAAASSGVAVLLTVLAQLGRQGS